jgi:Ca2+-binding RTX toxin-like protein
MCLGHVATIVGTPRADGIEGTDGPDVIMGLGGADRIRGNGGDDVICAGPNEARRGRFDIAIVGRDLVEGGPGNDLIAGGPGIDALGGGKGNDRLYGGPNGSFLIVDPATGERTLIGDVLAGAQGIDSLFGGRGVDLLTDTAPAGHIDGGPGLDTCYHPDTAVSCELRTRDPLLDN